mmetsp:Transcript_14362/g.45286  ORF Transcript_14362/g.45286 Transcript_14362/m.45286 type:complete len:309 (+) Transcript_14362:73-999(+)
MRSEPQDPLMATGGHEDDEDEEEGPSRVVPVDGDVELSSVAKEVFEDEADDYYDGWLAPLLNPNKGDASNMVTFFVLCSGLVMRAFLGRENAAAAAVLAFGLFGFAGGVTNALAVTMLFDRIPLLVGSGVIPRRFKEILAALKTMILDTFFDERFLRTYVSQRSADLVATIDLKSRLERVMHADGFDAALADKLERLAATPDGQILATLAPMFGGFATMTVTVKPMLLAVGIELLNSLTDNFDLLEYVDVASVRDEIDRALSQRMTTLTPSKVRRMMSRVIRDHLGWLVVWGNVFGGIIGLLSWVAGY